jgi:hypothetical protein
VFGDILEELVEIQTRHLLRHEARAAAEHPREHRDFDAEMTVAVIDQNGLTLPDFPVIPGPLIHLFARKRNLA